MKLEDQVCSLELAKKLKELGVKQESYFYWSCDHINTTQHGLSRYNLHDGIESNSENWSAFTVAELGEILKDIRFPMGTWIGEKCYQFLSIKCSMLSVWLQHDFDAGFSEKQETVFKAVNDTEANMRAKMLIYLIENKLIEVPK